MIRFLGLIALALLTTTSAQAADNGGFGSSFSNTAPAALGGGETESDTAMDASALADMAPAAGDENTAAEAADKTSEPVKPESEADIKSEEEKELEAKFKTDVTRTEFDRGDGNTTTHDRMSDDKVGVYYETEKDEKLNDSSDTIGVNVKLLEFK